jgi:cytoskeletal protein CcmA (bactofilin family)
MSTPCKSQRAAGRRFLRGAVVFLSLGASGVMFSAAAAAPQSGTNPPASAEERANLRQALESRYEVLPVQGGIVLKPRQPRAAIRTVEVTSDGVAINGQRVPAATLHDWLGADADLVLRLQGLSPAEQRQVFGLEGGSSAPAATPAAAPTPRAAEPSAPAGEGEVAEEPATAETPEAAETPVRHGDRHTSGSRVNVGGSVTVDKDEVAAEVVAVGGSATVEGEVEDGVTAIGGPARIDGKVGGEVVSVGSSVYLGSHAEVEGDVTSVGGTIHKEKGARVQGRINEVGLFPFSGRFGRHVHFGRWGHDWEPWPFWGGAEVVSSVMFTVVLSLLVCLVLLVARASLERVDRQLVARPWPSAAVGLAGFVFFWPLVAAVTILLAITIIGCALFLLYPFFFLFVGLLLLLGYAAVAYRLGRLVEGRFGRDFGSPYVAALVGVLLIQVWSIFGHMLDMLPGPFGFFSIMVGLFGFLTQAVAWIVGFGAVILARFGLEPGYWQQQGAPVVPPAQVPPAPYEPPAEPLPLSASEPPL